MQHRENQGSNLFANMCQIPGKNKSVPGSLARPIEGRGKEAAPRTPVPGGRGAILGIGESAWSHVPVMLFGVLLFAPAFAVPDAGSWMGIRVFANQAVALGLLALLLVKATWTSQAVKRFIVTGPNLAVILLITWAALSFLLTAPNGERGRGIALAGFMRLACGAAIYFTAMFFCRSRSHLRVASLLLLIGGIAVAVAGMLSFSPSSTKYISAGFGNSQLLGAFLAGLLPVAVVLATSGEMKGQRFIAWVATLLVGCALLLTCNRSGWLGSVVGLFVVAVLAHRAGMIEFTGIRGLIQQKRSHLIAAITALVLICSCFALSGAGRIVLDRAKTLTMLSTVELRLQTWRMGVEMLRERPLIGWGIGSFPLKYGEFYERGGGDQTLYPVPSAAQVANVGVGLSSTAHNEYVQLGVELGLVGLALYLAVLGGFFYCGIRAFYRMSSGSRRWLLLAALGAVAAQCTDGIANPAWRFRDVSPLLWLMMGIGVAAMRMSLQTCAGNAARIPRAAGGLPWQLVWRTSPIAVAAAAILALCITSLSSKTVMAVMGLPEVSVSASPDALFGFEIIAKTAPEGLTEIADYVSINDTGNVAFVAQTLVMNRFRGFKEPRANVYVGPMQGDTQPITAFVNNNLTSPPNGNPEFIYSYGPVQINNDNSVAAVQAKFDTTVLQRPATNSVDVWHFENSLNHYVPQLIASANLNQWIFSNVSVNNEGGSDNPVVTGLGRVAFKAQMVGSRQTYLQTNATPTGALSPPILIQRDVHPLFPMIADDGRVVIKAGAERDSPLGFANSIRLYDLKKHFLPLFLDARDYALETDFNFLGSKPGISDDGLIVAFAGNLTPQGATRLNEFQGPILHLTPGPGIFALISTQRGNRTTDLSFTANEGRIIVRVAGVSSNGQFDPGEVLNDKNGNGVFDSELKEDGGVLQDILLDQDQHVNVNNLGTVVYLAKDTSGKMALFASRINVYAVTASVDPPVLIANQGDTISGLSGTIQDIRLYDSINNRGEGDVAFWVRMDDPTALRAIVRARPKACDRPTLTQFPARGKMEVSGYDWKMQVGVSSGDGIVVENVRLRPRYFAEMLSVPYLTLKVRRSGQVLFDDPHVTLVPSRLIDFQVRSLGASVGEVEGQRLGPEADKIIIVGTYAIHDIPSTTENCLLVTQRYEFRKSQLGDIGAPGWERFQAPMSRFFPVVQYVFVGEQSAQRPHNPAQAEVEVVQRLHFRPDDALRPGQALSIVKSAVTIFFDGWQVSPPDVGTVPLIRDPLPIEQNFIAVSSGSDGQFDNYHQTWKRSVDEPIPPVVPGCWECVHIHWRWSFVASTGIPTRPQFGWGRPLIPVSSKQTVEIGISRFRPNEVSPLDFRTLFNLESINFGVPPDLRSRFEPVMWYASKNDGKELDHDAFFTHGGHFSVVVVPQGPREVSEEVRVDRGGFRYNRATNRYSQAVTLTNSSDTAIPEPISLALENLSDNAVLSNRSGITANLPPGESAYVNLNLGGRDMISPGQRVTGVLEFINPTNQSITYDTRVWAGVGGR